jgi:4-amino-4-deoxy-L-arabinose transferase-like glycosyltransferase
MWKKSQKWIKENQKETLIICAIILVACFLRFYRISEYMTFLGDEGRDAIIIKKILVDGDLPFIGPPTSVGNMYLGPLYYYMMALPMAIFWLNPVAAAAQVALIGVLSIGLIYYLARIWFGKTSATIAAILYTISPVTITYSKSSWNPNPAPFFALLTILGLYKSSVGDFRWFILVGIALAFSVQMHYLALLLIPVAGVIWLRELKVKLIDKQKTKYFYTGTILAIVAFLILMSPLFFFDLKHNFTNYHAVMEFFSKRETTVNLNPLNTLGRVVPIYINNLVGRYMAFENPILTPLLALVILIPLIVTGMQIYRKKQLNWPLWSLNNWLLIGVLGLALYKQNIFDHYLGFLNPVPYLLFGALFSLKFKNKLFLIGLYALFAILVFINLQNTPLKNSPNRQLQRTQEVAKFVISKAQKKDFNFALIAKSNYDAAYQFYLDQYGHKPKQVPIEITDQLFVVCEDPLCEPVGHSKYEIAGFGWTKIDQVWEVSGVKVYKLVANPMQHAK